MLQSVVADHFGRRYGPRALIVGASEGLGAAFARALAARGLDLLLVARRAAPLRELAAALAREHGVDARPLVLDAASADGQAQLLRILAKRSEGENTLAPATAENAEQRYGAPQAHHTQHRFNNSFNSVSAAARTELVQRSSAAFHASLGI